MLQERKIRGFEFERYIFDLLKNNDLFKDANLELQLSRGLRPDIIISRNRNNNWEKLIIEIKSMTSYTNSMLITIVEQLKLYQSFIPDSKLVFVFPGEISLRSKEILEKNDIEVWDIPYISKTFSKEIKLLDDSTFKELYITEDSLQDSEANLCTELINKLKSIASGKASWSEYQKLIKQILDLLFSSKLSTPIEESSDFSKTNRRDFILRNYAENGFWALIRNRYLADFIVIDAKNYSKKVSKREVLQISNYLKAHGTGLFGIIISRNGGDKGSNYTCRDLWALHNKLVIILDDNHIINMLLAKKNNLNTEEVIQQEIEKFRLSI